MIYKKISQPLLIYAAHFLVSLLMALPVQAQANPFGAITNPLPYGSAAPGGGLLILLNNILRLVFVVAGIFAFLKIIVAGLGFMNAGGDPKKIESAWANIWQSLMGLVIIISSIAIAALMGLILFGDEGAILNPVIYGPTPTFIQNAPRGSPR